MSITNIGSHCYSPGFDSSFGSAAVKIYPFTTLCWVNRDENISLNKVSEPIGQHISSY